MQDDVMQPTGPPASPSSSSSRERHHLFFALWPDASVRSRIAAAAADLRQGSERRGRWIDPSRYHLTVCFLGMHATLAEPLVQGACAAAARICASAFDLTLDVAGSFGNARTCWLGCREVPAPLPALHHELSAALREHGVIPAGDTRFVPHVTVLRDADRALPARLPSPITWRVGEFVLIGSRIAPPAPYRLLARWALH
jgi:2'-5' RNA ligase